MNKFKITLLFVLILTLSSCENDYYDRISQNGQGVLIPIIDELKGDDDFSKFVTLLEKSGMDKLLVNGPVYTIFAPTNEAIDAYDMVNANIKSSDMDSTMAREFVEFHIAFGIYYKYDFEKFFINDNENRYSTRLYNAQFDQYKQLSVFPEAYFGKKSKINYSDEFRDIYGREYNSEDSTFFVESAKVIPQYMDKSCSNGVIHGIDRVLKPTNNVLEELRSNPDFSTYYSFIARFDTLIPVIDKGETSHYRQEFWYTDELGVRRQINNLFYNDEETDITVFAASNEVLDQFFEPYMASFGGDYDNISDDIIIELLQYNQSFPTYYKNRLYEQDMYGGLIMASGNYSFYPYTYVDKAPLILSNGFIYPVSSLMAPNRLSSVTGKILLDPKFTTLKYIFEETGIMSLIANATYASSDFIFGERVSYPESWTIIAPMEVVFSDSLVTPILDRGVSELGDMARYWVIPGTILLDGTTEGNFEKGTVTGDFTNGYYETLFGTLLRKNGNTIYSSLYADSTAQIVESVAGSNGIIYLVDDLPYNMRKSFNVFSQIGRYSSDISKVYNELTNGLHSELLNSELLSSKSEYTLFFPTDKALDDYDDIAEIDETLNTWEQMSSDEKDYFIRNHIIRQRIIIDDQDETEFYSSVGNKLTLFKSLGQYKMKCTNDKVAAASFIYQNLQASNGVFNTVDKVLIP